MLAFDALADPTRQRMIEMLAGGPRSAGALGEAFSLSQPSVSHHLKRLREAGVVSVEVKGQQRIYSLDLRAVEEMEGWLRDQRSAWQSRLRTLQSVVARRESPRRKRP